MQWIAPSEKGTASATLERQLWAAADQLRANSELKAQEYSAPLLGLILLRFAAHRAKPETTASSSRRGSRLDDSNVSHAEGLPYLPPTTTDLCRMNLAVHGLEGDIKQAISYYDDPHAATGCFDFVLANPLSNVNAVDKERLKDAVGATPTACPHRQRRTSYRFNHQSTN